VGMLIMRLYRGKIKMLAELGSVGEHLSDFVTLHNEEAKSRAWLLASNNLFVVVISRPGTLGYQVSSKASRY